MTNKVLLNNVDHGDLRVVVRHDAELGDGINQVLVFPTEFEELQREYPIFFRRSAEGELQAVALLGFDHDENLFLADGRWQARYVPALQARGPFSIVLQDRESGGPEPMIHVDLDDRRVGRSEGEPIFLPQGGNAPYLEHVTEVLRRIYTGIELARTMYAALAELELLQQVSVQIALDDAKRYDLPDLYTIEQDRLAGLAGSDLERLHRAGFLRLCFLAAASLGNVGRLIELKNRTRA